MDITRTVVAVSLALSMSVSGAAQGKAAKDDPEAHALLEQMAAAVKDKPSVTVEFNITVDSQRNGQKAKQTGSLKLQGEQYVLVLGSITTYSDGKTVWVWQKEVKEVDISDAENDPDEMTPARLFQSFNEGYRQHLVGKRQQAGRQLTDIDLYPLQKNDLVRLRLSLDAKTLQLAAAMQQMRNGDKIFIDITSYKTDASYPAATFHFDTAAHPDVEVVDLR